jgi:hypothetical protein
MPNWCHNYMKITGAAEELAHFKQACIRVVFEGEPAQLDFNALIPMPDIFKDDSMPHPCDPTSSPVLEEDVPLSYDESLAPAWTQQVSRIEAHESRWLAATGFAHPNDWATKHWGTQWNAHDCHLIADESNYFEFQFRTAWSPPIRVWERIAEAFPTLEIHLEGHEPLMEFAFRGTIKNGKLELRDVPVVWSAVDPETDLLVSGTFEQIDERVPGVIRVFARAAFEGETVESSGPFRIDGTHRN